MAKPTKSETVPKEIQDKFDGPLTREFVEENPQVTRTIAIQGRQTLADLHTVLFRAFGRQEEHGYEFQVGGKGPNDPNAQRYGLSGANDPTLAGEVSQTSVHDLGLTLNEMFGYWFDFGDNWWHMVEVTGIDDSPPRGQYPKVVGRIGASPPQYAEMD